MDSREPREREAGGVTLGAQPGEQAAREWARHLRGHPCLPRPHAHPAVSEEGRLLWGLVTPGQQYLVRPGSVSRAAGESKKPQAGSAAIPSSPAGSRPLC